MEGTARELRYLNRWMAERLLHRLPACLSTPPHFLNPTPARGKTIFYFATEDPWKRAARIVTVPEIHPTVNQRQNEFVANACTSSRQTLIWSSPASSRLLTHSRIEPYFSACSSVDSGGQSLPPLHQPSSTALSNLG